MAIHDESTRVNTSVRSNENRRSRSIAEITECRILVIRSYRSEEGGDADVVIGPFHALENLLCTNYIGLWIALQLLGAC
jgi:hypothetical protein